MNATLYFRIVILVSALLGLALQLGSLGNWREPLWGYHLYSFLPLPVTIASWLATVLAAWAFLRSRKSYPLQGPLESLGQAVSARPVIFATLLSLVLAATYWLFRSQQNILGDGLPLINDLPNGKAFHPRQPFVMWFQQFAYRHLHVFFDTPGQSASLAAWHTVAIVSVASGLAFAWIALALSRSWSEPARKASGVTDDEIQAERTSNLAILLAAGVLLTQGYCVLFFGYLENYALILPIWGAYLWSGILFLQGRAGLWRSTIFYLLALGAHLSTIILLPSFLFLFVWGLAKSPRRRMLLEATIALVLVIICDQLFRKLSLGFSLGSAIRDILITGKMGSGSGSGNGSGLEYMFSFSHVRDFFNNQFLTGPWTGLLLIPASIYAYLKSGYKHPVTMFLFLAAVILLLASWLMSDPTLGYARDWDLFAPTAMVCTTAALYFLTRYVSSPQQRVGLLMFLFVTSALHLGSWAWINHDEGLSLQRMQMLPLGNGRAEVVVGNWHLRHGNTAKSQEWFAKALAKNPRNSDAYALLAMTYLESKDYYKVAELYKQAVALRPDKPDYRNNLAQALIRDQQFAEAIPQLKWLVEKDATNTVHWLSLSQILTILGRNEERHQAMSQALPVFVAHQARRPREYKANFELGQILETLGRSQEALGFFQVALELRPNEDKALFNVGFLLRALGQPRQAQPYFEKLLRLFPDYPQAEVVRSWLE